MLKPSGVPPPVSPVEVASDLLHGVTVSDPYRWLEDQDSPRTRAWLSAQSLYTRSHLDAIAGREQVARRVRELLDVETYDSVQKIGQRYLFRKRVPGQEQPAIYFRESVTGRDQLLLDPAAQGYGKFTAVMPLRVSPDGRLLLYEIKEGGERTGAFALFDAENKTILPDALPRGYLRGFAFAPDSRSFYYVHESLEPERNDYRAVYRHVVGTGFCRDEQVFLAGNGDNLRLYLTAGNGRLGFLVYRLLDRILADFYIWPINDAAKPDRVIANANYGFGPLLLDNGRILAITDRDAPNLRIVEVCPRKDQQPELRDVVPTGDYRIERWVVTQDRILVSYVRGTVMRVDIYDHDGRRMGEVPVESSETVRLASASTGHNELFLERESFTAPPRIESYCARCGRAQLFAQRAIPFQPESYSHIQVWFAAGDGTRVPMFLVGRSDLLAGGPHPTVMTAYGAGGVAMTPQFSVLVAFLMERGCLFALPNIRGGSEFGAAWHMAARRRHKQVAIDDFLSATEWLIAAGRSEPSKLAIFGGSNSGLLVAAAMTQRPDLFRVVLCMVPLVDMLRYHLFDHAHLWKDEYGTAEDATDFAALAGYSPYHRVREGTAYPATMIVSGDADQNCNPLHARKMTARLQNANVSRFPILLDYDPHRGHAPVLPLSTRVEALTDRLAFICEQLGLDSAAAAQKESS
jgi:prolyl oligopeptidase